MPSIPALHLPTFYAGVEGIQGIHHGHGIFRQEQDLLTTTSPSVVSKSLATWSMRMVSPSMSMPISQPCQTVDPCGLLLRIHGEPLKAFAERIRFGLEQNPMSA